MKRLSRFRNWVLPTVAGVGLVFTMVHVFNNTRPVPPQYPPIAPAKAPFETVLAGAGLIEPRSENVRVGADVAGVVHEVAVVVSQRVRKGELLFRLDARQRQADLEIQRAQLAAAEADLARTKALPRPEDLPPSEARIAKVRATVTAARDTLERTQELVRRKVVSDQELIAAQQNFASAEADLQQAEAEDKRLRAGAWSYELAVARAEVLKAQKGVEQAKTELERLEVRAPIDGTVLKVDVRPGEFVGAPPGQPLIIMGDVERLHVRVDIDEQDVPRFRPGLPAKGAVRGDGDRQIDLAFVRVEPFAEPKRSLTGAGTERVDTRVLQVIYALAPGTQNVYVGQQMDVYIDIGSLPKDPPPRTAERATRLTR